jgi:hypothetical protein
MEKLMLRALSILAFPLLLSGCFLMPGNFVSSLDVRRDGSFNFAYKGEMIFISPNEIAGSKPKIWSDKFARCFTDKDPYYDEYGSTAPAAEGPAEAEAAKAENEPTTYESGERACTKAELATVKKQWDEEQANVAARNANESKQFATLFGFNPTDDEANRKFAATMMKYDGWKSVTYQGKGVFAVDYQISSRTGHDFLFPLIPQGDFVIPFVSLRKREGASLGVVAPALVGGGLKALATRGQAMGRMTPPQLDGLGERTKGTFTVTTDGEILTNNTDDGPKTNGAVKTLTWDIGPNSDKIPEALIRFK